MTANIRYDRLILQMDDDELELFCRAWTDKKLGYTDVKRFAGPGDSPGFLLWQVTNRWQQAQRAALKPYGLTHVQFVVLASLTYLAVDGPVVTSLDVLVDAATQRPRRINDRERAAWTPYLDEPVQFTKRA